MTIREFETEEELEEAAERFEELSFEHLSLKEVVEKKTKELEEAEKDLANFEDEYKGQFASQ